MGAQRIVVVGAGMGGLASALLLADAGHRVTLVEAAHAPGGKARRLLSAGRGVDAGPTVFTMRWVIDSLFARIGARVEDHLRLAQSPLIARHGWTDGSRLDLFADPESSAAAVADFAGRAEADRFRAFSARAARVYEALAPAFIEAQKPTPLGAAAAIGPSPRRLADLGPGQNLWSALGRHFRDPRLRQLFGRYATYVGASPFRCPALLMLIWHVEAAGVWHVGGGMHGLAKALAGLAEARGTEVRYGSRVARIGAARGRAAVVRLETGEEIAADAVVFNGDASALASGLMPDPAAAPSAVPRVKRSLSALTVTGLAQPTGDLPLAHHTVFFSSDYRAEFEDIFVRRSLPAEPTVYVCAQDRGGAEPTGAERALVIINAPADGDVRSFPHEETERCLQNAWTLMERCGTRLGLDRTTARVTTPEDFAALFPGTGGALYGRAPHGMLNGSFASFLRPGARSRLPGLYLAGGSVHPGAGVPMALLSGMRAAEAVLADLGPGSAIRSHDSTEKFHPAATPGGISTASATTAGTASPSSPSSARCSPPTTPGAAARRRTTTAA